MEEILSVFFVTNTNCEDLKTYYETQTWPTTAGDEVKFIPGMMLVTQTIHVVDLFNSTYKFTHTSNWICTIEEFNSRFTIINDANRTPTFAIITRV